jgi:signal transduction histidine kinase
VTRGEGTTTGASFESNATHTDVAARVDSKALLRVLTAAHRGDFSARVPPAEDGDAREVATALNSLLESNERLEREIRRVLGHVGKEGEVKRAAASRTAGGAWARTLDAVNDLVENLARPNTEIARVISSVANGDLSQTMPLEIDGRPLQGQLLTTARTVNTMVGQLNAFAGEVTRVAREVGTQGKLGGQAEVKAVFGVWKDLTDSVNFMATVFIELYRAQQELRRYRSQLETLVEERTIALTAVNRELEAFSYSISHDLRGPLVAFDASSQQLLETYGQRLNGDATEYLNKMREASRRVTSVFDGLQMLFRLTSGEIRREELDVSAMAGQVVDELKEDNPGRNVEVHVAPGIVASGDQRLVRILLTNLIGNAWKFTSAKKSQKISVGRELVGGESRVFVRDNGAGFDMIEAHRLFGAFQRLHSQSDFPGAGIGLATARRIVNRHGGRIWAEGVVGEGATFYFVL